MMARTVVRPIVRSRSRSGSGSGAPASPVAALTLVAPPTRPRAQPRSAWCLASWAGRLVTAGSSGGDHLPVACYEVLQPARAGSRRTSGLAAGTGGSRHDCPIVTVRRWPFLSSNTSMAKGVDNKSTACARGPSGTHCTEASPSRHMQNAAWLCSLLVCPLTQECMGAASLVPRGSLLGSLVRGERLGSGRPSNRDIRR
jgi:hypothetical protein